MSDNFNLSSSGEALEGSFDADSIGNASDCKTAAGIAFSNADNHTWKG